MVLLTMIESAQKKLEHSLDVLSVHPTNSWDDIEQQYRQLIQRWHPDRNSGADRETAQNKFIEINTAYKLIREHYRKNGAIPRRLPPEQKGPLLGTRKETVAKPALYKNKLIAACAFGLTVVGIIGTILWSLDSRLAENNRDRAKAEKNEASVNAVATPTDQEVGPAKPIKQSSNALEP